MKPEFATPKTTPECTSGVSCEVNRPAIVTLDELCDYIEDSLANMEDRFADFITPNSLRTDVRSNR